MSGSPRTYAPLRRVLALLKFLTEAKHDAPLRVFTHDELLEILAEEYESGPTAERTLRGDIQALRARGLVVTNLRHPGHVRRRGVRRNTGARKPERWWLRSREHRALQEMRQALGGRLPSVAPTSPPTDPQGRANARVEDAFLLIRLLEEAPGEVNVDEIAAALGVGRQQAQRWLTEVADVYGDALRLRNPTHPDSDDYDTAELMTYGEWLAGTGSDLLGLFPYSAPELHERLRLLDDFAASPFAHTVDESVQTSIRRKLTGWLAEVERATERS